MEAQLSDTQSSDQVLAVMPRDELDCQSNGVSSGQRPLLSGRELLSATPRTVWLLVALTGALAMFAAILYPNFRGPDEVLHVDLSVAVAERTVTWQPGTMHVRRGVYRAPLNSFERIAGPQNLGPNNVPPRDQRPSFDQLGGDAPYAGVNNLTQHPPLYYIVMGGALSVLPHWRTMPFDRVVLYLRLWTALMIIPVPWLGFAAAKTLGAGRGVSIAAAAVPLMSPQLVHIASSVNNDGLLTLLGAAITFLAMRVYRGDLSCHTAGQLGVLCSAALLTKGFGLNIAALVVVIYVVSLLRDRSHGLLRPILRCAAWFTVPLLVGGSWWIGNKLAYHRLQPNGLLLPSAQHPVALPEPFRVGTFTFIRGFLDDFSQRFWFDDPTGIQTDGLARLAAMIATVAALVLVIVLLARPIVERLLVLILLSFVALTMIVLARESLAAYRSVGRLACAQGRYLFGAIGSIGLVVAFGLGSLLRNSEKWIPRAAVTFALSMNIVAVLDAAHFYWIPKPGSGNVLVKTAKDLFHVSALPPFLLAPLILLVVVLAIASLASAWMIRMPNLFHWSTRKADPAQ
jgi:hypothetical protein